jgi:hypothetical protein
MPKTASLAAALCLTFLLTACSGPLFTQKPKALMTFSEARLAAGEGAVVMHAVNRGSVIATRWFKTDQPQTRASFTTFQSARHRSRDDMNEYDVVMVEPGTYALYSIYGNCDEGLRSMALEWDEPLRAAVATDLGMVYKIQQWSSSDIATGVGIWGGGGRGGMGLGVSLGGFGGSPGLPIAACGLTGSGLSRDGRATMATITVKAGEVVYAGELDVDFTPTADCDQSGNWMTRNETRSYCGAQSLTLSVRDSFAARARFFIENRLGPLAAEKTVVRLARPGLLADK